MSNEEIVKQIQDGIEVKENQERLWQQNRGFITRMIKKMCGFSDDAEDFEQECFIGLIDAAMKYDSGAGVKFLTYAGFYVRKAIIRYSENCCSSVRVPAYLKTNIRKYECFRQSCKKEKGRFPTEEEYLDELHISRKSLTHLEKTIHNMNAVSVNQEAFGNDGGMTFLDMLQGGEDIGELITYSVYGRELKEALDSALAILDTDSRTAIQSIYYQGNTVGRTAEIFGCSRQAVYEKTRKGFWKILHSSHMEKLKSFMPDGYRYNEYAHSEFAEGEESSEFLI